jgi:hypothetical protein
MDAIAEFIGSNAALLVAAVALAISLRSNHIAHRAHQLNVRSKTDTDRVRLFEKKRELLNEIDKQNTTLATLSLITAQGILVFKECPKLHDLLPDEFDRLKSNLRVVENLAANYEHQRKCIEVIDANADITKQDEELASVRRLTIHLEKDIAHEQLLLDQLRHLAATAPSEARPSSGNLEN